jgi:8-oxo-dGTP pyrophosphatase MutT (NUDIX family)
MAPDPPPDEASTFGPPLRAHLAANLARLDRRSLPLAGRRHAAVTIVVVDSDAVTDGTDDHPFGPSRMHEIPGGDGLSGSVAGTAGGPAVLLTRRAARLRTHSGQWALPGGRVDDGETPSDAARRELREELGLDLPGSAILGVLDDYATRSGFVMTPFVFWGGDDVVLRPDPNEVLSVHRVSFRELSRPDSPRFITIAESDRPVVQVPVGGDLIHAPTGAILLQFRRVALEGRIERVADYEQPLFAWQ